MAARAGDDDRAGATYRCLIRANYQHFAPYTLFGDYRFARGDRAEALVLYEEVLERNPRDEHLNRSVSRLRKTEPRQHAYRAPGGEPSRGRVRSLRAGDPVWSFGPLSGLRPRNT